MVGRGNELSALQSAWTDPATAGALVIGPAGVGKSRLVAEFLTGAERQGALVLRAVAAQATSAIPLGALAAIVPAGAWAVDRQEALVDLVIDGLVGRDRPVIVAIDDIDLLDDTSRAVINAIVAQRVAFVVATRRTEDDDEQPIDFGGSSVTVVALDDLPLEAVASILETAVGGPVAGDAAYQLWRAARGNPLLVRELTVAASESGDLASTDGLWQLTASPTPTPRIRELVAARLTRVQPAERDVLELLAVAGSLPEPLSDRLVMPVTVSHCIERGLAWWAEADGGRELRLAHPVYGEVLLSDLGVLGRRRLTARLLDGARQLPPRSVDVLRLATWQLDAGDDGDPALLLSAARRARRLSELDLAERLLSVSLARGGGDDALVLLGDVQFTAGDFVDAEATYREAERLIMARHAERVADPRLIASLGFVGIARGWNLAWGLGRVEEARVVNHAVRLRISDVDPVAASELVAEDASYLAVSGHPGDAIEIAAAVPLGPARVQVRRNHALSLGLLCLGRSADAIAAARAGLLAAEELPRGFGRESFGFVFSAALVEGLRQAGRLDEANEAAVASYDAAVASAHLSGQALSAWARGRVEMARGRVDGARRWFQESGVLERSMGTTRGRRRWAPAGMAMAMALAGDTATAHQVLDGLDAVDETDPIDVVFLLGEAARARARAFAIDGDTNRALTTLVEAADRSQVEGSYATEIELRHDALLLADPRDLRALAEVLLDRVPVVEGEPATARAAHAEALLARSPSGLTAAAEHFASLGFLRVAADVAASGARALDGQANGRICAALRQRGEEWLGSCGGGIGADADWALRRLAPRQREVARLAAGGLSNAEIAERLGRSPRTIENHLYRAYQELGVDDRRGLMLILAGAEPD